MNATIPPRVQQAMRDIQSEIDAVTERLALARRVNKAGVVAHLTSYRAGLEAALGEMQAAFRSE